MSYIFIYRGIRETAELILNLFDRRKEKRAHIEQ